MSVQKKILCVVAALFLSVGAASPADAQMPVRSAAATAAFWMRPEGDAVLLSEAEIAELNRTLRLREPSLHDIAGAPPLLSGAEVRVRIEAAAQDLSAPERPHLYDAELPLTEQTWAYVRENRAIDAIPETVTVRHAVALNRTSVRLLPSRAGWYSSVGDVNYDQLQGTVLDPGEAVLVLHETTDGAFAFIASRDYDGWVDRQSLADADEATWRIFADPRDFFTVTASRLPILDGSRMLIYQLGAKIPGRRQEDGTLLLSLPARDAAGNCSVHEMRIHEDGSLVPGRLPLTANNLMRLAFTPLYTEYGWGGQNEGMDCSSYVQNIYRAMGVELPRDADAQERACTLLPLTGLDTAQRRARVTAALPGALLFRPGHVMLYLGQDNMGTPLVIHAISSYYEGGMKRYIRQVVVSDLTFQNAAGVAAIDTLTQIGQVIP